MGAQAREITDEFAQVIGAKSPALADMQAVPAKQIKEAALKEAFFVVPNQQPGYRFNEDYPRSAPSGPASITAAGNLRLPKAVAAPSPSVVVDGELFPIDPMAAFASGVAAHLKIIIGSSRCETHGPHVDINLRHALSWEFAGAPGSGQATTAELRDIAAQVEAAYRKECIKSRPRSEREKHLKTRLLRNTLFGDLSYQAYSSLVTSRLSLPGACLACYCYEFTGNNGWNSAHGELSLEGHRDRHGLRTLVELYERLWKLQPVQWSCEVAQSLDDQKLKNFGDGAESDTTEGVDSVSYIGETSSDSSDPEAEVHEKVSVAAAMAMESSKTHF